MQPFNLTATGHNLNYLPEYIARRHGFFEEQGLDVKVSIPNPWDGVLDALADGTADMALGGIWVPAMYRNRVKDYTVFAQIANRCPLALLCRSPAKDFKIADVAGKTVLMKGIGGASAGLFFKMFLRENKVDHRSVDYIQDLDGKMLGELFEGGMGDYFVTDNLSAKAMSERNPKISVAMQMVSQGEIPWSVYYQETATITPEGLDAQRRFCLGLRKGIEWVLEHDAESYKDELVELFPNIPVDVAVAVTNSFRRDGMWTTPIIPRPAFDRWQLGLAEAQLLEEPFLYENLVNDGPAVKAQRISGPSSSGKTTLARLLQRVFCGVNLKPKDTHLNTFIIHEDDFYFPDDKIPYTTTRTGAKIQDWDTAAAIDIPFLSQALHYVRENGTLPPRLRSKEDQNYQTHSGVSDEVVQKLRDEVDARLRGEAAADSTANPTVSFLEGFLLFAPPGQERHVLRSVSDAIHLRLFLPAPYELVKARREGRNGYVTVGPAPQPPVHTHDTAGAGAGGEGAGGKTRTEVDLDAEDDRPPQNFWVDPPGYVDDIVWPQYVIDHSWLLIAEDGDKEEKGESKDQEKADLVRRVGDGTRARTDVGVEVAPGYGREGMDVVLRWAVELILGYYLDQT
ncbi:hypothetical protein DTO006G1_1640 [Penicillium roqueforti]|uniref:uncharacterized protein n=1 Tax=Penicillium roqueforti TaxID=5082 RepID=UPI00190A3E11|nr:uncharacterized protein LCP9604111_3768 [Penicillium roqueforti]KAF9250252.1 hypothetical protein LCP9604111_3768 [Penicillium roqueforti]KAI1832662.1 hypothetical protein CBS147337_6512 [Penicillium roqueforti]KAI2679702.1 hypothetical protein CBS147355_4184 [Penicillium roqueforti]KAI2700900.1 hypothetical protein CBS147372_4970 [Penicillium roqueforti]KAI2717208.1 hypothetical protein CBS147318_5335 [Penicillium roqueforti]